LNSRFADWGDYDNDGDLDLIIADDSGIKIYKNNGGDSFTDIGESFFDGECAKWGDYNNDGLLDVVATGNFETEVYRNAGSDVFVDVNAGIIGLDDSAVEWADVDNDGLLDIGILGVAAGVRYTRIYKNIGNNDFSMISSLYGRRLGDIDFGDFDNDGDLDIAYGGYSSGVSPYHDADVAKNNGTGTSFTNFEDLYELSMGSVMFVLRLHYFQ